MRLNFIPITWITLWALATLLMSGFASGSTVMNSLNSHELQTVSLMSCQTHEMSSHHQNIKEKDTISTKGQCKVASDTVQGCYDTTCVASVATLPYVLITASTSLALVTSPISGDVIRKTQNLYRPPIA